MSKYSGLEEYLKHKVEIILTYAEIEKIIGDKLPPSAYTDRTWWGNTTNPSRTHAQSWLNSGWKIKSVELGNKITLIRLHQTAE